MRTYKTFKTLPLFLLHQFVDSFRFPSSVIILICQQVSRFTKNVRDTQFSTAISHFPCSISSSSKHPQHGSQSSQWKEIHLRKAAAQEAPRLSCCWGGCWRKESLPQRSTAASCFCKSEQLTGSNLKEEKREKYWKHYRVSITRLHWMFLFVL